VTKERNDMARDAKERETERERENATNILVLKREGKTPLYNT
jgi:hypothetical protein